jgi:hypothetical protein
MEISQKVLQGFFDAQKDGLIDPLQQRVAQLEADAKANQPLIDWHLLYRGELEKPPGKQNHLLSKLLRELLPESKSLRLSKMER